jgi:hypothetical protein
MSRPSRCARIAAVAVLAVAAAGCTKTLDTDGLEGELKSQLEAEMSTTIATVDCPADVEAKAGESFECTAEDEESGATFTIRVTQSDDQGNVDWEIVGASE